nr:unnamed protein product [Spirometra erinaceieuropaei]
MLSLCGDGGCNDNDRLLLRTCAERRLLLANTLVCLSTLEKAALMNPGRAVNGMGTNMLGDIGRIPIITLSACKSLSEILSELPLPQPTPNVPPDSAKLLNDPLVEESAQTNLQSCKEWLVDILATALDSTSTDSITLKNDSKAPPIDFHTLPPLLKDTISKRPSLLEKNKSFQCIYSNKEVLQILSGGASKTGNSCGRLTSPNASSGCTKNDASVGVATKTRSQKQTSQPGLYSVVSVEPLKLSIKRAATHSQQATSDAGQTKERRRRRAPGKDTKAPKRASAAAAAATSVTANSHPTAVPAVTSLPVPMSVPVTYAPHSVPKDSTWVDRSGPQITPLSIPVARLPSVVPTPLGGTSAALASAASRLSVQGDSRPTQPTSRLSHESFTPNESLRSHSVTPAAPSVSTVTVSLRVSSMPTSESAPRVPLTSPPAASEPVVALSSAAIATTVNLTNSTSLTVSNSTNNPMLTQLFQPAAHFTPHQVDAPASCESSETVVAQKRLMLDQEGGVLLLPQDSNDAITGGVGGCGGSYNNSLRNNVVSGASSISSVPPSNVSAEGHAILQSGLLFEDPFSVPRSPSSVPSNCSYPATPVVSAMTVAATASVVPTAMPIAASPFQSHSCSSAISVVGATTAGGSATSINLFGVNVTPLQGDDAQSNSAPRGLAAYLKKSKCHTKPQSETLAAATTSVSTAATLSSPSSSSNPNHGSNNTLSPGRLPTELEEDAYTHQHGSAPPLQVSSPWSTDGRGSNPLVHPDQHPRRHIDKEGGCAPVAGGAYSSSLSNTPVNERENRLPGKRRASSLTPVPEEETGVSTKPPSALSSSMVVVVSSDNDTYAEAMVERVKRRRQQRGKAATSSSTLLRSDDGDLSTNEDTKVSLSSYPAASAPSRVTQLSTVRRSDVKSKQSGVKNCRRVLRSSDESEPEQPPPPPPPVQAAAVVAVDSPDTDSSDLSVSPPRKRGVTSTTRLLESEPSPHSSLPQQQNPSAAADRQSAKTGIRIKVEEETSSSELDSGSEAHKPPLRYAAPLSGGTGGGLMGAKSGLATASFTLKQENDRFDGNLSSSSLSDGTPASRQPLNRLGISSPEKMPRNTPVPPELEQMRPSRPPSSSHKPPRQPRSPGGPPPLLPLPQTANQTELPPSKRRGSKHYRSPSSESSSSSVFSEREPPFSKDLLGRKQQTPRHARRKQPSEMPSASSREVLRTSKGHHRARIADESHSNGSTSSSSTSSSLSSSDEAVGADERRRNSRMVDVSRKRRKTLKKSASYCRVGVHKTRRPSSRQAESGSNASGHFSSSAAGSVALSSSPLSSGREDNDLLVKTIASGANCGGGGGATPSTQPCTSSSALEDEDTPSLPPLDPCPPASPESPVSVASSQLSAARDFFQTEEPELEKQRCSEELTNSAAALTKFTAHISDILRRIEELDLLKIASAIRMTTTTTTTTSTSVNDVSDEGEEGGFSGDVRSAGVDRTPVEARLGRREINALYHESGQVRVAGSMSTVPTGHLVRLLTLLLVNIRDAATLPAPNPTPSDFRELLRRRKARLQRHHHHRQGEVTDKEQISESLLWSHPIWLRVLRGLDSALIALNIIAGPDVPRPLMMEDLIESICAIVHFHFSRLIDWSNDLSSSKRATTSGSGELAAGLSNLAKEAVGSRVGEALSALSSLVRLGGRFTDSLVLRLTELSLLLSGALLNSPVRRGTCPASGLLPKPAPSFSGNEGGDSMDAEGDSDDAEEEICRRLSARAKTLHAAQLEYYASNQWRLQLQRSTLGLIAAIYSRYDAHRKLIANDILALLSPRTTASATTVSSAGGGGGGGNSSATSMSRTPLRTFWILASGSFIKGWQPFQLMPTASTSETATPTTQSAPTGSNSSCQLVNNHYLLVHSFSALLLAVVQSLIPAPSHLVGGGGSSSRRCSSAGAPATPSSGVSQQSTTAGTVFSTGTGGDSHTADAIQLAKEEKALLTAHTAAFRAAHYLLTGLFKRASFKGEEDLKPILETVLIDFLRVAADAPLEWPAANLLLNAFGTLLIQQLTLTSSRGQSNHHHSSASNRASETGTRLLAADQLITLAGGLRRLSALRRAGGYPTRPSAHPAAVSSPEPTENKAGVDLSLTEAKLCVSAFLNSPVLSMYHLTLAYDDTSALFSSIPRRWLDRSAVRLQEYIVQRDFAYQLFYKLRFQHFDGLALTSRRFHQATWIQEASQQLSNSTSGTSTCEQSQQQPAEESLVKSSPKERRQVEDFRLQMLTEFVSTHPSVSGVAPWLPSRRNAAAAAAAGHHFHRGRLASPVHTDQLVSEQGAPTSLDPTAVAAFSPYTGHGLGVDARRRRTAAAHLLALKIFAHIDNSPGFDIIFASIVKLLYDQSVLLRARALKGLSILVDISPDCIQSLHPKHSPGRQGDPPSQGLLSSELGRVIPARLLDSSPAVREAAVELVGRLVAANPDLFMPIYYSPLVARVLDLCVSVRKRAVRSLQTLIYDSVAPTSSTQCLSTKQLVDICVILLRRLHDEDSVKKLVLDTFQTLWFTSLGTETDGVLSAKDKQLLGDRIFWLCEVMSNFRSRGFHVMEEFMNTILNMETTEKPNPVDKACEQIVHHLASVVQTVLACPRHSKRRSATAEGASSNRCTCNKKQQQQQDGKRSHDEQQISVSSALAALHLVAKCRASLVLQHAPMLVRLLSKAASSTHNSTSSSLMTTTATSTPSSSAVDGVGHLESVALFHTTGTIEACCLHVANVKRQEDSKFGFLFPDGVADFEKSLIILLQRQYRLVVDSALACLSTIVTFGTSLRDEVFDTLMFFAEGALRLGASADPTADAAQRSTGAVAAPNSAKSPPSVTADDVELGKKAIAGVSFLANRHDHLFCSNRLQTFFAGILAGVPSVEAAAIADLQCIILDCLTNFLMDEEKQMISNDSDWARKRKNESLKELGDRREGHGSAVAQVYLPVVLDYCILSPSATVRSKALSLVSTILRQGLVHPVQTIACLVCLQTDPEPVVRSRATQQLTEAEQKSPGFSAIRALNGIRIGFRLQCLVATSPKPALVRGASTSSSSSSAPSSSSSSKQQQEQENEKVSDPLLSGPIALNHAVYRILQANRQHRRSLISSLLVLFDLEQTPGAPIHSRDSSRSTYGQPGGVCSKMRLDGGDAKTTTSEGAAVDGGSGVRNDLAELIYVSDQLAHFPYKFQDEVFYLARNIDLRVSSLGSTVVRAMHECLTSEPITESDRHQRNQSHSDDFYDRKLTNLLEDAEVELFADIDNPATWSSCSSNALPEGLRPMERKLLERMNRAEVAALRSSARSVIIRNAPACLLLMSIRTYLKEAYDVTVAKLRSYSPSDPVKQWEKPISMSARCIQTGAYNRLLEIPLAVEHCALDCTWPVASLSFHSEDDSASETGGSSEGSRGPSDLLLLRIFLLLHRQLLATEDEGDLDLPVVGPSGDLPSEAATSRKAEAQATPTTALSTDKWPEGTGKGEPLPKPSLEKTAKPSSSSSAIVKDKLKVPKAAHKETHSRPTTSAPDQTKEDGSKRGNASTSVRSVSPMIAPARKSVPLKAKFPQSFTGPGTDASAAKKHSPGSNEDRRASAKSEHPVRPTKSISKDAVRKEHKHLKRTRVTLDISSLSSLESSDSSSSVEDGRPQKVVKKPKPESSSMKEKLKFQKTSHSDPKETMNGKRVPSDKLAKKPSHSSAGESKKLNSQGSTGGGGCSSSKVAPPSSKTSTKPKEPLPRRTMDLAPLPSAMQSNDNRLKERRKHKAGTDANRKTESRPFRPDVSKSLPSSKPVSSTTIAKKSISKQSLPQATTKNETSSSSHHVSSKSRVASPQKTKPPLIKPQKSHDPPSKKPALQVNCSDSDVSSVSSVSTVSTPPDSTYSSSSLSDSG